MHFIQNIQQLFFECYMLYGIFSKIITLKGDEGVTVLLLLSTAVSSKCKIFNMVRNVAAYI